MLLVFSLLKAIGLFMGASFFAYLLDVTFHEIGHALANLLMEVPQTGIALNPFGSNYFILMDDIGGAYDTPLQGAFHGAAGLLINLVIASGISLLLWRRRSPALVSPLVAGILRPAPGDSGFVADGTVRGGLVKG